MLIRAARCLMTGWIICLFISSAAYAGGVALDYKGRIDLQTAVEQVYERQRAGSEMRQIDARLLRAADKKVASCLTATILLQERWNAPITSEDLLAELERVVRDSKAPAVLKKLFDVCGNDPVVIQEVLLRPLLTDRRARDLYSRDPSIHAGRREVAEAIMGQLENADPETLARLFGVSYYKDWIEPGDQDSAMPGLYRDRRFLPAPVFQEYRLTLPDREGVWQMDETSHAFVLRRINSNSERALEYETIVIDKKPFNQWLDEEKECLDIRTVLDDLPGVRSTGLPGAPPPFFEVAEDCTAGLWESLSIDGAPEGREKHTLLWTGAEMIVWGGWTSLYNNDGYIYDPALDSWSEMSTLDGPTRRAFHRSFWTGKEMLVWGGRGYASDIEVSFKNSGGLYDPATDTWTATSIEEAPEERSSCFAVFTGKDLVVWGGWNGMEFFYDGGIYHLDSDSWEPVNDIFSPPARNGDMVAWTGEEMILWGGYGEGIYHASGALYNPETDIWTPIATENAPAPRATMGAYWNGREFVVWGGWTGAFTNTGSRFNPMTNTWSEMGLEGVPTARDTHAALYTGSKFIIWGGYGNEDYSEDPENIFLDTGGIYSRGSDTWTALDNGGILEARYYPEVVWTGKKALFWGGFPHLQTGAAYTPECYVNQFEAVDSPSQR